MQTKKYGLDAIKFAKYLDSSIVPLYLDALDEPCRGVTILVDSGPRRLKTEMLATTKLLGFYLLPGVPNTTHITQAIVHHYGRFKDAYLPCPVLVYMVKAFICVVMIIISISSILKDASVRWMQFVSNRVSLLAINH